jgi:tetratricopeptide (TPR) repeat protein
MKPDEMPPDLEEYLERVREKLDRHMFEEAWRDLQLVPESARDQQLVLDYSFWAANWLDYTEPAKELALKLMKLEPANGNWQLCYGDLVMTTHGPGEAVPWYTEGLRLSPDNQCIYVAMVDCLLALGRVEEAREFLLQTIERFPKQRYYASTRPEHAKLLSEAGQEGFASPKPCRDCNRAIHGEAGESSSPMVAPGSARDGSRAGVLSHFLIDDGEHA